MSQNFRLGTPVHCRTYIRPWWLLAVNLCITRFRRLPSTATLLHLQMAIYSTSPWLFLQLFLCWFYDECDGTQSPPVDSKLCPATSVNTYLDALRVCRGGTLRFLRSVAVTTLLKTCSANLLSFPQCLTWYMVAFTREKEQQNGFDVFQHWCIKLYT